MDIRSLRTPGLGDTTYLLAHDGIGVLVDPQRDVNRFLTAAEDANIQLLYVLETHLHNDYLSGGREVARQTGATLVLPAGAGVAFDHVPAFHLEEFGQGNLTIRPLHTPGHTPEHVSYLVLIDGRAVAVFSGGSLLVGAAGRPDLLGRARAWQLALAQHRSVQRLAQLPDATGLYPTHGEGSFCAASGAGRQTSTIGQEKRDNPVLHYPDAQAFAASQLADLQPYPTYYAFMGPINLAGPTPMPRTAVPELTTAEAAALTPDVWFLDGRPRAAFAAGHLPGSLGIEFGEDFGVWAGWLLPFNAPVVLVLEADQDAAEAATQLGRIGFDNVRGVLRGVEGWHRAGNLLSTFATVGLDAFAAAIAHGSAHQFLDVRSPAEWAAGHRAEAVHCYVPDVPASLPQQLRPDEPVWVACASGFRASIAAGLLERLGYTPVVLAAGGVPDLLQQQHASQQV